ncbi:MULTISPECIES: hypothetical protein [Paenibacillus]|uniref:Uncharacterized protein n=2 Tax=Paenibacillus TaxID=44249 RepID=A0ABX2ZBF0_PAEPO|nr:MULTISPECIES: hypothetical protein [Paenibacillus]MDR6779400.1 hypothetical protein [Paenibacillus peoriae]ODA08297.1 hypothetical protein A7312_27560 [Paenibacillus polymyxa]
MELFGIQVLESDWIDITEESIQYNEVSFLFKSLIKYDGMTVEILNDWRLKVWDDEGKVIDEFYLIENDEFRKVLYQKYPL